MKRTISILLSVIIVISLTFSTPYAFADQKTKGKCGAKVSYSLDTKTGLLTISGKGKMENFTAVWTTENPSPFYSLSKQIKKVEVKSGVTYIGSYTFSSCRKIKTVSLPESVKKIGSDAFAGCSALKKINLPKKIKIIPEGCFSSCGKLEKITLPKGLKRIEASAFSGCGGISSVKLPKSTEFIGHYAFCDCSKLKEIKIPKNCIAEESAFDCSNITYAEFENGSKIISESVFYQSDLSSVYIPKSIEVIWSSSLYCRPDIYYQGTKKDMKKIDILDHTDPEYGEPFYNNEYKTLNDLGKVYCNTSLSIKIPSVKKGKKGKSTYKVSVNKQKNIEGFEIEYSKDLYNAKVKTKATKGNTFTLKKLKKKTKYRYRVRAYKKINGVKKYSRWSEAKTFKL